MFVFDRRMCRAARQMVLSEQEESGMKKTCRSGKYFYRILAAIFWMSLIFTAGYGWYYAKHQIPEHFSVAEGEETSFSLDLPLYTTLLSESEEVVLKGDSGIPQQRFDKLGADRSLYIKTRTTCIETGSAKLRWHICTDNKIP